MLHKLLAVHDRAMDAYDRPWCVPSIGAAIRAFQDSVNDTQHPMNKHPDDYDLYHVGDYNDHTGEITPVYPPQKVAIGKQMIQQRN